MIDLAFNYPAKHIAVILVNIVMQVSVFCAVAFIFSRYLRKKSAVQYWILCAGLVLSLQAPFSVFCLQQWNLGLFSIGNADQANAPNVPGVNRDFAQKDLGEPLVAHEISSAETSPGILPPINQSIDERFDTSTIRLATEERTLPKQRDSRFHVILLVSLCAWFIGATIVAVRRIRSYLSLRSIMQTAVPINAGPELTALRKACNSLAISRVPRLFESNRISSPFVAGFWRPKIVWPGTMRHATSPQQLQHIFLHEAAHIARHDHLILPLQQVVGCLFWFHPLVTLLNQKISRTREAVCDKRVLEFEDAVSYCKTLFQIANSDNKPLSSEYAFGFLTTKWKLEDRIGDALAHSSARAEIVSFRSSVLIVSLTLCLQLLMPLLSFSLADAMEKTVDVERLSLEDIMEGVRQNEDRIKSLSVEYLIKSEYNFARPGTDIQKGIIEDDAVSSARTGKVFWHVSHEGIGRTESRQSRVNKRFDGSTTHKRDRLVSVFDGLFGYHISSRSIDGDAFSDESIRKTDHFVRTAPSPFDFTTKLLGKSITSMKEAEFRKVGTEEWEGRAVVVVEIGPIVKRRDYALKHHVWVDPNIDFAIVRRLTFEQRGEQNPWVLHLKSDSRKLVERAPRIWLPDVVEDWNYVTSEKGQEHMVSHDFLKTSNWTVNRPLPKERLKIEPSDLGRIGEYASSSDPQPTSTEQPKQESDSPKGFQKMLVRTVDDQGTPVADVRIYVAIWPAKPFAKKKANYFTSNNGECTVLMPDPPRLVRLWTQKPGYVPMFTQWWPKQHPEDKVIPREFEFKLPTGTKIGGTIEDENGKPIPNAIVEVMLSDHKKDDSQRAGVSIWLAEVPGPGENPCITDEQGRWSLDNVPAGEDAKVFVKLTHPEYVSDTSWGASQSRQNVTMNALRQGSAKITMRRGRPITGTVTSANGTPIKDALIVWGKDPYLQDGRQEVRTNAKGEYTTLPLNVGEMEVTVVAKGWSPEMTTVRFGKDNPKANFRLKKGTPIRLRFVDHNGRPIPNVAVGINRWRNIQSLYNHIHPNVLPSGIPVESDAQGIYEWTWAPKDEVKFWFYATGFETLNLGVVAKDELQTIMMNPKKPDVRSSRLLK